MPVFRAPVAASLLLAACTNNTIEYSSGFLVTVRSATAVDCIVLRAENPASGDAVVKSQPAEWRSAFRDKMLKVLVYPGGALDGPTVLFTAFGRRHSCEGRDVARAQAGPLAFERQVVPLEVVLAPLDTDADSDGWPVSEDCDDARSESYPGAPEQCDGHDDDCDDTRDDGCACTQSRPCFPVSFDPAKRNVGACVPGTQRCNTADQYEACTDAVYPSPEVCNGVDDDCDGTTDEGASCGALGLVCRKGGCVPEREDACDGGSDEDQDDLVDCADVLDCSGKACGLGGRTCCGGTCILETTCANGLDDDCDGYTDCADPHCDGRACDAQNRTCSALACTCPGGEGNPELCNAKDDDCDASTDEGFGLGMPCTAGFGVCRTSGTIVCSGLDASACSAVPAQGNATSEDCVNGLDDDCDNFVDCEDSDCNLQPCFEDDNPCTHDRCEQGACAHPNKSNGAACPDDGNECTNDACSDGVCRHPAKADNTACTSDSNECTFDRCVAGVCSHPARPDNTSCADDGNVCTTEQCVGGACQHAGRPAGVCCGTGMACNGGGLCNLDVTTTRDVCNQIDDNCDGATDTSPTCGGPSSELATSISTMWGAAESSSSDSPTYCNPPPANSQVSIAADTSTEAPGGSGGSVRATYTNGQRDYLAYAPVSKNGGWDLSVRTHLEFWLRSSVTGTTTIRDWASPGPVVVLCGPTGFRVFTPGAQHLTRNAGPFSQQLIPLTGGNGWTETTTGSFTLNHVNYVEWHARPNAAVTTATMWIDQVRFVTQ